MTKLLFVFSLALISASSYADVFQCVGANNTVDFGNRFTVVRGARSMKITDFDENSTDVKKIAGPIDRNYHPRPQNRGSLRYRVSVTSNSSGTGCDEAQVYLNAAMASGGNGRLTIAYDCDSDGSGPLFETYSCRK